MIRTLRPALLITACFAMPSHALERVYFVGQFGPKALLDIDGKQRIVAVGESAPEGVRLLAVGAGVAEVEYANAVRSLEFAPRLQQNYQSSPASEARVAADAAGSFRTAGTINGGIVDLVIDTGASTVAMNEATARKLGIDYRYEGRPVQITTASGVASAYSVTLKNVRVGEIEITNVDGVVVAGGFPVDVLLGMSFLNTVEITRKDGVLILKKTH